MSTGVDTKANILRWCGGALEGGDLRLLEDCSERGSALVSDAVVLDTARYGCGGTVRAQVCQRALTER